ncbi:hypothetical protein SAMD00019534_004970 [Acytostelium subglobosum LB1]|uniref:hypothetical protein n=1 Tax=Acytostelium subglobosum LB1 TaxID=1410327 RepID=UPI000644C80B|nr:hypothetical protein SAMD00019534_004970 [Acytostelium subglobosum LB1]GAM17322.1 hypothetical protein SAMD00019534_004970 [Acytostelium subglobosum LB1]|eukprot:XP_012759384.1 hypothetical protein SAMD00019534_004970 [Acytostelium subglobosum LB1]
MAVMAVPPHTPCASYQTLDVTFLNTSCESTITFAVDNVNGYDSIEFSPQLITTSFLNYSSFIIYSTVTPGMYNLTATKGKCIMHTMLEIAVPSIVITQPKCFGGPLKINVTGYIGDVAYHVDNADPETHNGSFVFENVLSSAIYHSLNIRIPNSPFPQCSVPFNYDPTASIAPKLVITPPLCTLDTGMIAVTNFAEFTSLTLKIGDGMNITATAAGVFEDLNLPNGSPNSFVIYAVSAQCSHTIVYPGILLPRMPSLHLSSRSLPCNNTYGLHTFTNNDAGPLPFTMALQDSPILLGVEYAIPRGRLPVTFSGCHDPIFYDFRNYFMPVTHTIGEKGQYPTCDDHAIATVSYPGDYANLNVSPNPLDSNHQISVFKQEEYTATSQCYALTSYFGYPTYGPNYIINSTDFTCVGVYQVTVLNYEMFDSISISNVVTTINAVNGVMDGLYQSAGWVLTTVEKGCTGASTQQNSVKLPSVAIDESLVTYEVSNVTQAPGATCLSDYSATIHPVYKGVKSLVGTFIQFNNSNKGFVHQVAFATQHCIPQPFTYNTPAPANNAKATVIEHAKCLQTYGLVNITFADMLYTLSFNGTGVPVLPYGTPYKMPVGTTTIHLIYDQSFDCEETISVTINPIDTTTVFRLNITPQDSSNCSNPSARISFTNPWSEFNWATIEGEGPIFFDNATGVCVTGSTRTTLKFDHKTCGEGQFAESIVVPTDNHVTISYKPIYKSSCASPIDSNTNAGSLSIVHNNGMNITADNVYGTTDFNLMYNRETGLMYGLPPGNLSATVQMGYCNWNFNYVQKFDTKPVFKVNIIQMPTAGMYNGIAQIVMLRQDIYIVSVQASSGYSTADRSQIIGWNYSPESPIMTFSLLEFRGCRYQYSVNLTSQVTITEPRYTITPPTQCGDRMFKVQFDQLSLQTFEIFAAVTVPDVNGVVLVDVSNNDMSLRYRPRSNPFLPPIESSIHELQFWMSSFGSPNVQYTITPETCYGARDGMVTIFNTDPSLIYVLFDTESDYQADTLTGENTVKFRFLTNGQYQVSIFNSTNSYCVKNFVVQILANEPSLVIAAPNICDKNKASSSISLSVLPATLSATYTINGNNVSAVTNNVAPGTYTVVATISSGVCSRILNQKVVIKQKYLNTDQTISFQCGQLTFYLPSHPEGYDHLTLMNSKNQAVSVDIATSSFFNYINLDTDSYRVVTTDLTGCQVSTAPVQVTSCNPPPATTSSTTSTSTTGQSTTTSTTTSESSTTTTTGTPTTTTSTTTTGTTTGLNSSSRINIPALLLVIAALSSIILF